MVTDLASAQAGDEAVFSQVVAAHRRELYVHCYRMLGGVEDAEDAVQEALAAAWFWGLPRFEGRSSLRSWLYRIASNACLRYAERGPRRLVSWDYGPSRGPVDDLGDPTEDVIWVEPLATDLTGNPQTRRSAASTSNLRSWPRSSCCPDPASGSHTA